MRNIEAAQANNMKSLYRLCTAITLLASAFYGQDASAAVYRMANVQYKYSMGGGTSGSGCNVLNTECIGSLTGSFSFTPLGEAGGLFSQVNITASSSPDYNTANQPNLSRAGFKYDAGYALAFNGSTQIIYFYNTSSGTSKTGYNGIELSLSLTEALGAVDPQVANFTASTANDNFCNQVDAPTVSTDKKTGLSTVTGGCTASKNNISSISGAIQSPSPAVGFGLIPLLALAQRRNGRGRRSAGRRGEPQLSRKIQQWEARAS